MLKNSDFKLPDIYKRKHNYGIQGVDFSSDRQRLLIWYKSYVTNSKYNIVGYDIANNKSLGYFGFRRIKNATFNKNANSIAVHDESGLFIIDLASKETISLRKEIELDSEFDMVFSNDDVFFSIKEKDGMITIWDRGNGDQLISGYSDNIAFSNNNLESVILNMACNFKDKNRLPELTQLNTGTYLNSSGEVKLLSNSDWLKIRKNFQSDPKSLDMRECVP